MKQFMQFQRKPYPVQVVQWHKNGDHPNDAIEMIPASGELDLSKGELFESEGKFVRYFRDPNLDGETPCSFCKVRMHDHGFIDKGDHGLRVCPGDFIVHHGDKIKVLNEKDFYDTYERIRWMEGR